MYKPLDVKIDPKYRQGVKQEFQEILKKLDTAKEDYNKPTENSFNSNF